jgi:hypothetical protein
MQTSSPIPTRTTEKKCALYQNRIYYQSAEQGEQGVYSMRSTERTTGWNFEAEDIRALA